MSIGTYTVEDVEKRVLSRMGITTPETQIKPKILNEINAIQSKIYDSSEDNPNIKNDYIKEASATFIGWEYDLTSISDYKDIDSIRHSDYGNVTHKEHNEFENYKNNIDYRSSYIYTKYGDIVKIKKGIDIPEPPNQSFYIKYRRRLIKVTQLSDKLDIRDNYFDELCDTIITKLSVKKS